MNDGPAPPSVYGKKEGRTPIMCCDPMICWQFNPMRQRGASTRNCDSPKLTQGVDF